MYFAIGSAYNAGLMDISFIRLIVPRPYNKKGHRIRGAFRSSKGPKYIAKACVFGLLYLNQKLGKSVTVAWAF